MNAKQHFRNLSIQRKLLLINSIICASVLLIAVAALFTFQIWSFHTSFKRDSARLAGIIAKNCTAAVAFDDRTAANEIINSLRGRAHVQCVFLVNASSDVIALFGELDDAVARKHFPPSKQFRYYDGSLLYSEDVKLDGKVVGTLFVRTNYNGALMELVRLDAFVFFMVLVISGLLTLWLSARLGKLFTNPLLSLAGTARFVGEQNDYSVRSEVASRKDELGLLASAFNHMLERIQTQGSALTLSQQKLESLVNSIDGIVWEWDAQAFVFTYVSQQSKRILGYPPEAWLGNPKFWDQIVHPDDVEKATNHCLQAIAMRQPYSYEYRMIAADKRVVWIRESGVVLVGQNQSVTFRGILQDISEQKRAAGELEVLNRQLVDTSRAAGMAEVATGVLHNVGNVLNSVNVSVNLVSEKFRGSKAVNVGKISTLINQHQHDLGDFLTKDPKGRQLPDYLTALAGHLADERATALAELDSLRKNVDHIKDIVSMQQSFAKVSGVIEDLSVSALVEDALQMNTASLANHKVTVLKYFAAVPPIPTDKHKVLQILVNLIRNAKHALDERGHEDKQLTLRISWKGETHIQISVTDNGVGIPKENLVRVFNHGFTTKPKGHGFGLHSGANAAKELGGALTMHSDGPGTGATFTLELPLTGPKQ